VAVAAAASPIAVVAPPAPQAVEPFVLPLDSLQAIAQSAGLEWVNSDEEKIRAVQVDIASQPAAVHVPRERKPVAAPDEGPLVLVETRKDLSQIKLPFEVGAGHTPPPA
jgi:ribonuclease E